MNEYVYGNLEYCYNGIPVIRGYCSAKLLLKHSKAHDAYQRATEAKHVEEIKSFISSPSTIKFMPEVVLSYDYTGLLQHPEDWADFAYTTPIDYLHHGPEVQYGSFELRDHWTGVNFKRLTTGTKAVRTVRLDLSQNALLGDGIVFQRIDGNHRLSAFEESDAKDMVVPFCIVLLCSNNDPKLKEREKAEMEVFHNINAKVKPLSSIEQYRGLFNLFTVAELEQYGKEFSLTKAYLEKHKAIPYTNISFFTSDLADIILFCIKFFVDRGIEVTEDEIATVLGVIDHTYFSENEAIRNCKSRFAIVPYVFYCYEGGKQKTAKLSAYNTWFIKNRLYNVKDFDPASMIDVFNSIYEIRQKQIFVAMPFKSELLFVYEAIREIVEKINRENGTELLPPVRIDKQIVGFSYDIVNEMLDQIQNAGLLIADLTEENANVYYEAGFAQGLLRAKLGNTAEILYLVSNPKKPDEPFDQAKFDVKHYKMIPYKNDGNGVKQLKEDLEKELKAFYSI